MTDNQYVIFGEPLYYMCRLDRYSPITSRFISWGAEVATPLTQEELVKYIVGDFKGNHQTLKRRLHDARPESRLEEPENYHCADNNHSGYWSYGFVHALGRSVSFWNLDGDYESVVREAFKVDPLAGAMLLRLHLLDVMEKDSTFIEALQKHSDLNFMHWLDQQRHTLPPEPDFDNYDVEQVDAYYNAVDEKIFDVLSQTSKYNEDFIQIILRTPEIKNDILNSFVENIFPQNDQAEGYILNGFRTMIPSDAMRGAIFMGNICQVLEKNMLGQPLISTIDTPPLITNEALSYPTTMSPLMPSDYLTNGPFEDLKFRPKQNYPTFGWLTLLETGYTKDLEMGAIFNPASNEEFRILKAQLRGSSIAQSAKPK